MSRHIKPLIIVVFIYLVCVMASGAYLMMSATQKAHSQAVTQAQVLARQSTLLLRPLLLAEDRVSLNYVINELADLDYIAGVSLTLDDDEVLARAGTKNGISVQRKMLQQDTPIGVLSLWLNPSHIESMLFRQLAMFMLLALLAGAITCGSYLWLHKPQKAQAKSTSGKTATDDEEDGYFDESASDTQALRNQTLHHQTIHGQAAHSQAVHKPPHQYPEEQEANTFQSGYDNDSTDNKSASNENSFADTLSTQTKHLERESTPVISSIDTQQASQPASFDVSQSLDKTSTLTEEQARQKRDEEQLSLYSEEDNATHYAHPSDAAYVLYVDTTSAHSQNSSKVEREELLNTYSTIARKIAGTYGGTLETLSNKDIRICFAPNGDGNDSHGLHAVMSGLLFTQIYRGYNSYRINQFKPVLNIHTALVRGYDNTLDSLDEEARFLTRTTQSNELISHTPLTHSPMLKRTILLNAETRREDADKELICRLQAQHQELLEKQADHMLRMLEDIEEAR